MRDIDTIDSELRLVAALCRSIREHGGEPSRRQVDAATGLPNRQLGYFHGRVREPARDP